MRDAPAFLTNLCSLAPSRLGVRRPLFVASLFALCGALFWPCAANAQAFSFDDIEFWIGAGENRAGLVIDWDENAGEPPALAWGYRWDGAATGGDMLAAIVAADRRLYAKLGGSPGDADAVYGLGYDANGDGQFILDDDTVFDADGIAYTGPADAAVAIDPDDYYGEGWFTAFWHYGVEMPAGSNPYDGGGWSDIPVGMALRELVDGAWDSWVFSPTFNFAAFAENPVAALAPFPPGDFNHDGRVDALDYDAWRTTFGSTSEPAADANANGIVDAADFVIWRHHASGNSANSSRPAAIVPEPASIILFAFAFIVTGFFILIEAADFADLRRWMKTNLRQSVQSVATFFAA